MLLDMFKGWYTLEEAAARLSRTLRQSITERDVIQLAAEGHINASWFLKVEHNRHAQTVTVSCDHPRGDATFYRSSEIFDEDGKAWGSLLTGIFGMPVDLSPAWGWWLLTFIGKGGESGNYCGDFLINNEDGAYWELYNDPRNGKFTDFPAKDDVVITRKDIEAFEHSVLSQLIVQTAEPTTQPAPAGGTAAPASEVGAPAAQHVGLPDEAAAIKGELWALADARANEIRKDSSVSLNAVCADICRPVISKANRELMHGQKGWHTVSWLKGDGRLKGWQDPIDRK